MTPTQPTPSMPVAPGTPLARKLAAFVALSGEDAARLARLQDNRRRFAAGHDLVSQGQSRQAAYVLLSGWVCSYKIQGDGSRQIVDIQIPGDFLGLRSVLLRTSDHGFEPITDIEAAEVEGGDLTEMMASAPRLGLAILWAASRDEAMVVEHLVGIGRRDAQARVGHFLLELGARLSLVGLGSAAGFACPLTQGQLADAVGLSAVHVNRVLRQLREAGMITFRDGHVTFEDRDRLADLAGFDPAYLDHTGPLLP